MAKARSMKAALACPSCGAGLARSSPAAPVTAWWDQIDVYPTVIDLLSIAKPEQQKLDGVSYANVLKSEGELTRTAYFNYHPHAGLHKAGGVWVRSGDWKLLRWFGNPSTHELYNLKNDLSEADDLAATQPDKVKELSSLIDAFLIDTGATYPRPNPAYKPVATKAPTKKGPVDPLDGWKERGCKASVVDGILTLKATGKPSVAFLGHGTAKMTGPAEVTLRIRSTTGGAGKIESYCQGLSRSRWDDAPCPSTSKPGTGRTSPCPSAALNPLGTLRAYLPDADIDFIEIAPDKGKALRSDF